MKLLALGNLAVRLEHSKRRRNSSSASNGQTVVQYRADVRWGEKRRHYRINSAHSRIGNCLADRRNGKASSQLHHRTFPVSIVSNVETIAPFFVSTHEIALPISDQEANTLIVRSCNWNGDRAIAWDIDLLEANTDSAGGPKTSILGSRKRILFVEGDSSGSLDLPLYSSLFPGISILPKGGCANVLRAVSGLRGSEGIHHVEAFGLIDRDNRPEDEVKQLASEHVYALGRVCGRSSLLLYRCNCCCSSTPSRVPVRQRGSNDRIRKREGARGSQRGRSFGKNGCKTVRTPCPKIQCCRRLLTGNPS